MKILYNKRTNERLSIKIYIFLLCTLFVIPSCKKFVAVDPPITTTTANIIFTSDATAAAALTGIYSQMAINNNSLNDIFSLSVNAGLSADEFTLSSVDISADRILYSKNQLNSSISSNITLWSTLYTYIYEANSAIAGLNSSSGLTPVLKNQLLGEAYFVRAFCNFYLVNLYGDIPIVVSTDYTVNQTLSRTPKDQVYQLIINDLKASKSFLSEKYLKGDAITPYSSGLEERVRPNLYVAESLLSRAYLFSNKDYPNAEAEATSVINNKPIFDTVSLNNVFVKNSKETIWAIQPVGTGTNANTGEAKFFIPTTSQFPTTTNPLYLSQDLINSFEPGDKRLANWANTITSGSTKYYYPYKYKVVPNGSATSASEYPILMRLAEIYLIRAEARAQQSNLSGALSDLNLIRKRAGLPQSTATTQAAILLAIYQERRIELYSEMGHRWLDLKRTSKVDQVMTMYTPLKGGTWNSSWALYPIPLTEIQRDPYLIQNPGY